MLQVRRMAVAGGGSGGWGGNGNIPEDWRLDEQSVDSGLDRAVDMYIPPTIGSEQWSGDCRSSQEEKCGWGARRRIR